MVESKFWAHKSVDSSGCWNWLGSIRYVKRSPKGYGVVYLSRFGKLDYVHRAAYKIVKGDIPAGLVIRHKCDNSICFNPEHLEIGTVAQNNLDSIIRGRKPNPYATMTFEQRLSLMNSKLHKRSDFMTHCKNGHEYTPENTRIKRYSSGKTQRVCKTCHRAYNRRAVKNLAKAVAL